MLSLVRTAEAAGVESAWASEELFHWDAFGILGYLAGGTDKIRLGPGVTSPYIRPPHLQAMSIATLDRLSQGRAFLGLGRSMTPWYRELLGMDVGDAVPVVEENISLLRQWWQKPYAANADGYFKVRGLRRDAGGAQERLPIYVAAVGPRMVEMAARVADGLVFSWPSLEFLRKTIPHVKSERARAGADSEKFLFAVQTGFKVTENAESALEGMKEQMGVMYSLPGMDAALTSPDFDVPRIVAGLRQATRAREVLSRGGWTREFRESADYDAVRRVIPDGLAAQVAVVGSGKEVRRRLAEYQALGVTHIFVPSPEDSDTGRYKAFLEAINP
jgi:5,10-methylenetetrahydromethanopterin reductase